MTVLHDLYRDHGQSPWLDNLKRSYLTTGELKARVDGGIRGVTSNPTIFQKAISGGSDYDDQFEKLLRAMTVQDAYWQMVMDDVRGALSVLRSVHDESDGTDGFVSIELAPAIASSTEASIAAARDLHLRIDRPNLFVKIPATAEGIPAVRAMIAEGRSINITLIFGLDRYAEVIEAYLSGLEGCEGDLSRVASVASFFVSRVDTEVDRRLEAVGAPEALALRGRFAVAQAKLAYDLFKSKFAGPRWDALASRGARVQRPLWASTSTKNPDYPDLLYVDNLIGPDTVNTMPDATIDAFVDHGRLARTLDEELDDARAALESVREVGIDLADVSQLLEDEGVAAFSKSYDELLQALSDKAGSAGAKSRQAE